MNRNAIVAVLAIIIAGATAAGPAMSDTRGKKIALSNNYDADPWHQAMLKSWETVTGKAVQDGVLAEAKAFTTAENKVDEQKAQIQSLIEQHYDAIVINAASPDALNGVIKQACDAGIVVVSFYGTVTEPCAWRLVVDFKAMGRAEIADLKEIIPDGGNLLEIRGMAGASVDDEIHAGIQQGIEENAQFKIIGSVQGDWSQDTTQKAVAGILASLPEVKAVVTQGGDGYGAAQAFAAAGRPTPIIVLGNRHEELKWWKEQKDASGYKTMSAWPAPGISTLAFWLAQMILDGQTVPKDLTVPLLRIGQDNLESELANTKKGGIANTDYTLEDAKKVVDGVE